MAEQQATQNHSENIAELLEDDVLGSIGSELNENYMQYTRLPVKSGKIPISKV